MTSLSSKPALRQPKLADMIAADYRRMILDGELAVGSRLPRQQVMAEELGVSLTVVREALRVLETQGLITVHRGRTGGASVRFPDDTGLSTRIILATSSQATEPEDIDGTIRALDGLAARLCAERTQSHRQELLSMLTPISMRQDEALGTPSAFNEESRHFHRVISGMCGLRQMSLVLGAVEHSAYSGGRTCRRICEVSADAPPPLVRAAVREHRQLIEAVEQGLGEEAFLLGCHRRR